MSLEIPQPPAGLDASLLATVKNLVAADFATPAIDGAQADEIDLDNPQALYSFTLEQLAAQEPLNSAYQTGWRYFVLRGKAEVAAVDATLDPENKEAFVFAGLREGDFLPGSIATLQRAEGLPDVVRLNTTYQRRIIGIAAAHVMAVWMKDLQDEADRILLIPRPGLTLDSTLVYGPAEFLKAIRPLAAPQIAFNS